MSIHELAGLVTRGLTIIPFSSANPVLSVEKSTSASTQQSSVASRLPIETLTAYMHSTGIEGAYGFFAPNVPASYRVVFEFHYADGRVMYDLPRVGSRAAELRLGSLLDKIGLTDYELFRERLLGMLASSARLHHADATIVRAIFGILRLPDPDEFAKGARPSYEFLCAYDFSTDRGPVTSDPH